MPLSEVFRLHGRLRGSKAAIRQGHRSISYRSLDRLINGVCFTLKELRVRRGDFVGVALRDSAEHLIVLLALSRYGAVIVPIDCRWSESEQQAVAAQFGARFALIDGARAGRPEAWPVVSSDWFSETDREYVDPEVGDDSPLLLSLSAGTTGMPKGPCATHRQFENRFMAYWINLTLNAHDRFVLATPLYHGGGRGFSLAMLFAGATVCVFPPPYEPHELIAHVAAVDGTAIFLVPTILRRLLESRFDGLAFPSLRKLISSGSALYPEERVAVRQRLTPHLYEIYSSTEGGATTVMGPEDMDCHPDSVGRPAFRVQVEIVDDSHRPVPPGEVGRLRYRSPASPQGYFLGDSSEAFRDGWFYPGDLAVVNADGFVFLKGRVKDMIIRGGVNIYPGDIEQVLLEAEQVTDAVVLGVPSRDLGEEVAAFVVASSPIEATQLVSLCRARLAAYKVPSRIFFVESLPRNSAGKVLKAELARMAGAG